MCVFTKVFCVLLCALSAPPSPVFRLHLKFRKRTRPSGGSPSPVRPKRFVEQHTVNAANISSTATGNVYIINVDPKGKYVQIKNMADQVRLGKLLSI